MEKSCDGPLFSDDGEQRSRAWKEVPFQGLQLRKKMQRTAPLGPEKIIRLFGGMSGEEKGGGKNWAQQKNRPPS